MANVQTQFEVRSDRVAGHGDMRVQRPDGRWIVIEVKSVRTMPTQPDPRHVGQAKSYAVLSWADGFDVAGVLLVYVARDDLRITEFWMAFSDTWTSELNGRIAELDGYLTSRDALPPRLPGTRSRRSRACYGCAWMDRCWDQPMIGRSGIRRRHGQLSDSKRLEQLQTLAQDGVRVRRALRGYGGHQDGACWRCAC